MLSTEISREYYTRKQVLLFVAITAAISAAGGRYFFPSCPISLPLHADCAQYTATKVNSKPAVHEDNSKPAAVVEPVKIGPNGVSEPEYLQKYEHVDHTKPLIAVPVKNGKTQHFSHIKFTAMQKSKAFHKPDWCISAPQYICCALRRGIARPRSSGARCGSSWVRKQKVISSKLRASFLINKSFYFYCISFD